MATGGDDDLQQLQSTIEDIQTVELDLSNAAQTILAKATELRKKYEEYKRNSEQMMRQREANLDFERAVFEREKDAFEEIQRKVTSMALYQAPLGTIDLQIGNKTFTTCPATINSVPESVLAVMLNAMLQADPTKNKIKIDRDPEFFDKILNFLRDGESSLLWLKDTRLTEIDLQTIRNEAHFYQLKDLFNFITWELNSRKPKLTDIRQCGFKAVMQRSSSGQQQITGFQTKEELVIKGENLNDTHFVNVLFSHKIEFIECYCKGVVFKNCRFLVAQTFVDCDLSKAQFTNCTANLPPSETLLLENSRGTLPNNWL